MWSRTSVDHAVAEVFVEAVVHVIVVVVAEIGMAAAVVVARTGGHGSKRQLECSR